MHHHAHGSSYYWILQPGFLCPQCRPTWCSTPPSFTVTTHKHSSVLVLFGCSWLLCARLEWNVSGGQISKGHVESIFKTGNSYTETVISKSIHDNSYTPLNEEGTICHLQFWIQDRYLFTWDLCQWPIVQVLKCVYKLQNILQSVSTLYVPYPSEYQSNHSAD